MFSPLPRRFLLAYRCSNKKTEEPIAAPLSGIVIRDKS